MKAAAKKREKSEHALAIAREIVYEPAPEGATCENPTRQAFVAARKIAGEDGIDIAKLTKCGKPATIRHTTHYVNMPDWSILLCDEHRPRIMR